MTFRVLMFALVALVATAIAPRTEAAPAFVRAASNATDSTSATTLTVTFGANLTAGNAVMCWAHWGDGAGTATMGEGGSGSDFTGVGSPRVDGSGAVTQLFYKTNVTGGGTTVTVTFNASRPYRAATCHEVSGLDASPLDGTPVYNTQASPGTGTDGATSGNLTTGSNGDYIFGMSVDVGNLANTTNLYTAGTNFTEPASAETSVNGTVSISSEYLTANQTTAGAIAATFTLGQATAHITGVAAFKAAGAGGGGCPLCLIQQQGFQRLDRGHGPHQSVALGGMLQ